jgi:hypothetical protein
MSPESVPDLAAIKLLDMSLVRIAVEWKAGLCTADIDGAVKPAVSGAQLRWIGVTEVDIPRGFPWGPSISINEARGPVDGRYEVEMQSGDTIVVRAVSCEVEFSRDAV